MHITSKGQVTIPKEFRDLCGLYPETEVEFQLENGRLMLQPAGKPADRGTRLVEHMRQFIGRGGPSADEIMEWTRGE